MNEPGEDVATSPRSARNHAEEAGMVSSRTWLKALAFGVLGGVLIFAAACKDNNNTSTSNTSSTTNTAATQVATMVPTQAAAAGTAAAAPASGAAAETINENMTDNKFSVTAITVKVGQPLTINAKNNGQAIHNWDLLDKDGVSGTTKTDLLQSGQSASITMTFSKAGKYKFQCDVHPTEMIGTVTVTQ
jgi:plastocyanin